MTRSYARRDSFKSPTHIIIYTCSYIYMQPHTQATVVTVEWVVNHIRVARLIHEWVICLVLLVHSISMRHVTHINESCHTDLQLTSYISMNHVRRINKLCHTYQWVMSHISMSDARRINASNHTYQWDMSYVSMSHVTSINQSCHKYHWVMSHISMCFVSRVTAKCVINLCLYFNLYLYQNSYMVIKKKIWRFLDSAGSREPFTLYYKWLHSTIFKKDGW